MEGLMSGSTCSMVNVSSHKAWSVEGLMTGSKCVLVSVRTVEGLMTGSKGGLVNVPQCGRGGGVLIRSNCGLVNVSSQCGQRGSVSIVSVAGGKG